MYFFISLGFGIITIFIPGMIGIIYSKEDVKVKSIVVSAGTILFSFLYLFVFWKYQ